MKEWYCAKDKVKMEEVFDIALMYGDMELPEAEGLRCPVCGMQYIDEETVTGELASAEQMLEAK